jgi:hypothetical protein
MTDGSAAVNGSRGSTGRGPGREALTALRDELLGRGAQTEEVFKALFARNRELSEPLPEDEVFALIRDVRPNGTVGGATAPAPKADNPRSVYQSARVPELQECHESHVCEVSRAGQAGSRPPSPQKKAKKNTKGKENPLLLAEGGARDLAIRLSMEEHASAEGATYRWPFLLARRLKSIDGLTNAAAERAVRAFIDELDAAGVEHGMEFDDVYLGVVGLWDKVKYPEGQDPLTAAARQADKCPLHFGKAAPTALYDRLGSVAYHLSRLVEGQPFVFPQKQLAELLGTSQITVSRVLQLLVKFGVLAVEDGEWSYAKKKAKTYRFAAPEGSYGWKGGSPG